MHRDIELDQIDDIIIVIKPNRKTSVGSHNSLRGLFTQKRKIFSIVKQNDKLQKDNERLIK